MISCCLKNRELFFIVVNPVFIEYFPALLEKTARNYPREK